MSVSFQWLIHTVPCVCPQCVNVVFSCHTQYFMYFSCVMLTTILLRKREIADCFTFNCVYAIIRLFGIRFFCSWCPGLVCDCDQTYLCFSSRSLYAVFCPVDVPKLKPLPSQTLALSFNLNKEVSICYWTSQQCFWFKTI